MKEGYIFIIALALFGLMMVGLMYLMISQENIMQDFCKNNELNYSNGNCYKIIDNTYVTKEIKCVGELKGFQCYFIETSPKQN